MLNDIRGLVLEAAKASGDSWPKVIQISSPALKKALGLIQYDSLKVTPDLSPIPEYATRIAVRQSQGQKFDPFDLEHEVKNWYLSFNINWIGEPSGSVPGGEYLTRIAPEKRYRAIEFVVENGRITGRGVDEIK